MIGTALSESICSSALSAAVRRLLSLSPRSPLPRGHAVVSAAAEVTASADDASPRLASSPRMRTRSSPASAIVRALGKRVCCMSRERSASRRSASPPDR